MTSFGKKLQKSEKNLQNAVVLGTAFGNLESIVNFFNSVFVFDTEPPKFKKKNLIYNENFNNIDTINEVSHVFVDLNKVSEISKIQSILTRFHVRILIEGTDVIDREKASLLWNIQYIPIERLDNHHLWIKKQ